MSRLDCCSTTFLGVVDEQIVRIQMIQNKAARPIFKKKSKHDHVTLLLKELYWLSVKYCIQYKFAMLAFHYFDGTLLPSMSSSLCIYQPSLLFNRTTSQNSKDKLEKIWWMFFWLHCSDCLELTAG